jgi:RNase P subunit RPR2
MKQMPSFDIDLDKHYNATVVIACEKCGRENRHHLKTLAPDQHIHCSCGADITLGAQAILLAQQRAQDVRSSYRV